MTAPPHGLGAHDSASVLLASIAEPLQTRSKLSRHRIVCGIAKALHLPVGIGRWLHRTLLAAKAAELGHVLITDLPGRQRFSQIRFIELWVSPRPRHRPDVDNE